LKDAAAAKMEVIVKGTNGILPDSILSIRNGSTRRQSPLQAVDKPFKFPAKPEDNVPIKFDVFRHVGTARTVSKAGTSEQTLILDAIEGQGEYQLTSGMDISFELRPASQDTITMGSGFVDPVKKDKVALESDEYLEQHKVQKFLQSILQGLIKERPLDPYGFIVKQFVAEANQIAAERAAPDPMDQTRDHVRGLLNQGLESGLLDQILAQKDDGDCEDMLGTKARLNDATSEVQDLRKLVDGLQLQLGTLTKENTELRDMAADEKASALRAEALGENLQIPSKERSSSKEKQDEEEVLRKKIKESLEEELRKDERETR